LRGVHLQSWFKKGDIFDQNCQRNRLKEILFGKYGPAKAIVPGKPGYEWTLGDTRIYYTLGITGNTISVHVDYWSNDGAIQAESKDRL
jgi:hypothetical protein